VTIIRSDPRLLRGLHYFEAVARLGSVASAAKEMGVSSSAVSHQLSELADRIGEKLVEKKGRGIALTEAGTRLATRLRSTFSDLDSMLEDLLGGGTVRLSVAVCSCFGPSWLAPRLPSFVAEHPGFDLETRLYHQDPEQTFATADAIVTADPAKPGYTSITLFEEKLVAVWRPGSAAMEGPRPHRLITTDTQPDVLGRDWLDFCHETGREIEAFKHGEWILCSHYILALEMARAGLGVALVPDFLAALHVGQRGLAHFDEARISARRSYRLCYKSTRAGDEKIRIFSRWLKAQAARLENRTAAATAFTG
jgi:LysR family transcriptional regulator, glycine cleavage system transcriptional activator